MNMSTFFKENNYAVIKNAISDELRDFVTQYALFDELQDYTPEEDIFPTQCQSPKSHSKFADPAMETMLLHLHKTMEESTGLKLYPTYSYYRVYRNGDELKPHTDRPACEISSTLCFGYDYGPNNDFNWPIFLMGKKINLLPGELLIYKGFEHEHWREKLMCSNSAWQVQGFFHYVDVNGPYADQKYDLRENVGFIPKGRRMRDKKLETTEYPSYIQFIE
jgi:hypothetical protein